MDNPIRTEADAILSNKQWMRRLCVVMEMEKWVADNLKKKGEYDRFDRHNAALVDKGKEYFYGYLFWGRRKFPTSADPLFFDNEDIVSDDGSLASQLEDGKYPEFIRKLNETIESKMKSGDVDADVTYGNVSCYVGPSNTVIETLKDRLPEGCSKDHEIIGLILRYRCVGGFESNLHGSVTADWGRMFDGYTECFASPLNHKFNIFHSVFDEDGVFGGSGDFFKMVGKNEGVLPSGSYEINPPFHSTLLDQVAEIVDRSFRSNVENLKIVMIVPKWSHTNFIPKLDNVCFFLEERGYVLDEKYGYKHTNGRPLTANTKFYVLASNDISINDFSTSVVLCKQLVSKGVSRFRFQAAFDQSSATLDRIQLRLKQ